MTVAMTCTTTWAEIHKEYPLEAFELDSEKEKETVMCELQYAQSVSGSNIDSRKLAELLRMKFGAGAYNIHVVRNSYCIVAPKRLSTGEIAKCRRM